MENIKREIHLIIATKTKENIIKEFEIMYEVLEEQKADPKILIKVEEELENTKIGLEEVINEIKSDR